MKGTPKSQGLDEFVQVLYRELFADLQQQYPTLRKSLCRDLETLISRISTEGLSFATKTLPRLGKMFDAALDSGQLEASPSFVKMKGSRTIPAFLQGMFSLLFTVEGFLVGGHPSVVKDIRQVLYLVYKLELPYSKKDECRVIDTFLENEEDLLQLTISDADIAGPSEIVAEVLEGFDPKDILPKHGPGAVATGEKLDKKWLFSRLFDPIHQTYPYYDYFIAGGSRELLDRVKWYRSLSRETLGVAKVVLVPKDSRGPRLISCEPLEYQWIQQGLNTALVRRLESHRLTRGQINFSDQTVNRDLARESSQHHAFATVDLKDASDRVSLQLVRALIPKPLLRFFEAVRSHATRLPDGRVVPLAKYAPMGSAVCFSVEALCFWSICVHAVRKELHMTLSEAAQHVYVYGDDLVVPTLAFDAVLDALERVGLLVNKSKCCSRGDFRESCGMDAYKGIDVTPTRISTLWSCEPSSGQSLSSYTAYANDFWQKGYTRLATTIWKLLESVHGVIPRGTENSGFPCVVVDSPYEAERANCALRFRRRFNPAFQRFEYRVKCLIPFKESTTLESWPRLLRFQVGLHGERPDEVVHPRRTKVRERWRPV